MEVSDNCRKTNICMQIASFTSLYFLLGLVQYIMRQVIDGVPARHIYEGAAPCPIQRPARIIEKIIINYLFLYLQTNCYFVFSDSRCKNIVTACRFVPMFSSIALKIVPRPRFVRVLDCDRILVFHA